MNRLRDEAASWFARIQNAPPDHPDRAAFEAWIAADAAHAQAYASVQRLWSRLDSASEIDALAEAMARRRRGQDESRRHLLGRGACAMLLAGGAGGLAWRRWRASPTWRLDQAASAAPLTRLHLPDGSTLTLGAGSAVRIALSRGERRVALDRGEASFDVTRDVGRPFVVEAGPLVLTVLGTRFAVLRLADRIRVSLDHGRVRLKTGSLWRRRELVLEDGQVAELPTGGGDPGFSRLDRPAAEGFAFERGRLVFDKAGLREIAESLSRYRRRPIRVALGSVAPPRVTAVVQLTDVDAFLASLPRIYPVTVSEGPGGTVLSTR